MKTQTCIACARNGTNTHTLHTPQPQRSCQHWCSATAIQHGRVHMHHEQHTQHNTCHVHARPCDTQQARAHTLKHADCTQQTHTHVRSINSTHNTAHTQSAHARTRTHTHAHARSTIQITYNRRAHAADTARTRFSIPPVLGSLSAAHALPLLVCARAPFPLISRALSSP